MVPAHRPGRVAVATQLAAQEPMQVPRQELEPVLVSDLAAQPSAMQMDQRPGVPELARGQE